MSSSQEKQEGGSDDIADSEQLRSRDLLRVPCLLSLSRLLLAGVAFAFVEHRFVCAGIVALAALTDVLDGYWARRFHQVTRIGALLDPMTDKTFAFAVVAALILHDRLTILMAILLSVREVGELPLILWTVISKERRSLLRAKPTFAGKSATAFQAVALASALFLETPRAALTLTLATVTGVLGAIAAVQYWLLAAQMKRFAAAAQVIRAH